MFFSINDHLNHTVNQDAKHNRFLFVQNSIIILKTTVLRERFHLLYRNFSII